MRKFLFVLLLLVTLKMFAQPVNKVYWVGPSTGANLNAATWSVTSGGAGGAYPSSTNYQLIFDGAGTSQQTYTVNVNTTTGGYIYVTNNTTVILKGNFNSFTSLNNSGYKVDAGSQLIFEQTGISLFNVSIASDFSYSGVVNGEIVVRSPFSSCVNGNCSQIIFNLSNLITFSGTKVLTINGTLRLEGTRATVHTSNNNSLVFGANSSFVLNADLDEGYNNVFDPSATIYILGRARSVIYPNVIYNCTSQADSRIFSGTVKGDMSILNTGTGTVTLDSVLKGNLTVQGTSKVQMQNATLDKTLTLLGGQLDVNGIVKIKENVNNQNGVLTATGGGTLQFVGTAQQIVATGTMDNDALSFEVNNPAGILLNANWTLPSHLNATLKLSNGNINMGTNTLIIQNPSPNAVVGGTASSHIIGKLKRSTNTAGGLYVFPVSNSTTESANIKLYPVGYSATTYEISFNRPSPYSQTAVPFGIRNAGNYVWDITRTSGIENADLSFVYGANNFVSQNPNPQSDLRVLHWNGISWDNAGGSGANGEIFVTNISTFSPFTLGTAGQYALPVNLTSFLGIRQNNNNLLKWTVTQKENVEKYEIERSADGRKFSTIGELTATQKNYTYIDNQPFNIINYYRLKMVNNGGKFNYSQIISIKMIMKDKFEVYPNPAFNIINIQYTAADNKLVIQDAMGRIVKTIITNQKGNISTSIDISTLIKGTYFIKAGSESVSFVKQ